MLLRILRAHFLLLDNYLTCRANSRNKLLSYPAELTKICKLFFSSKFAIGPATNRHRCSKAHGLIQVLLVYAPTTTLKTTSKHFVEKARFSSCLECFSVAFTWQISHACKFSRMIRMKTERKFCNEPKSHHYDGI